MGEVVLFVSADMILVIGGRYMDVFMIQDGFASKRYMDVAQRLLQSKRA